jgi:hypothetical protein
MGDMADMLIEQGFEMMMDGDDAWDYPESNHSNLKTCKYCGATGFHWVDTEGGWRLADYSGKLHNCWGKEKPPFKQSVNRSVREGKAIATRCPVCGDEYGMSPGTGDWVVRLSTLFLREGQGHKHQSNTMSAHRLKLVPRFSTS